MKLTSISGVAAAVLLPTAALADAIDYIGIKPGVAKMTQFEKSGDNVPLNQPVIRVYAKGTQKYSTIANDHQNMSVTVQVRGACKGLRKLNKARLYTVSHTESLSVNKKNKTYAKSWKTIGFKMPFAEPDTVRGPVAACNAELDRLDAKGRNRYAAMKKGFVVRYDDAYDVQFDLYCKGTFTYADSRTTSVPVWVACEPTPNAGRAKKTTKTLPAEPRPGAKKKEPAKLVSKVAFRVDRPTYVGVCPVKLSFTGKIHASRAGTVKYRMVSDTGRRSAERTMKFTKAGSKPVNWTRTFKEKKAEASAASTRLAAAPSAGPKRDVPDHKGWERVVITSPKGMPASKQVNYSINCRALQANIKAIQAAPQPQ
ncbi:MAG: hypothetical protein MI755_00475 [Sphingomonadales bacterium]|nr:hypothetical protein [Sphingomonadales bacterium]